MTNPIAVLISDIHYSIPTLEQADYALRHAIDTAGQLDVPVIIAGDLHDTKANLRGECTNRIVATLEYAREKKVRVIVIIGNHDLINESGEEHSLGFLSAYCDLVKAPVYEEEVKAWLVPYINDQGRAVRFFSEITKKSRVICHQGVEKASMGHYVQDKTALPHSAVSHLQVVSGHYHKHQTIKTGKSGSWTFIGTPYTITAAEANDGPKGYCILDKDGSLSRVLLPIRKHIVIDRNVKEVMDPVESYKPGDVVWLKVHGPDSELRKLKKKKIGEKLFGNANFKLDLIPDEQQTATAEEAPKELTEAEIADSAIDRLEETTTRKEKLKKLWREII